MKSRAAKSRKQTVAQNTNAADRRLAEIREFAESLPETNSPSSQPGPTYPRVKQKSCDTWANWAQISN